MSHRSCVFKAEPAVESAKAAKAKAEEVVSQSREVANTSKNAIEVARRQRKAKDATTRATDKAQRSFRYCMHPIRETRLVHELLESRLLLVI